MYYAQIDEKGRVHTVCELAGIIESPNVIPIETWDESLLGKYYDPASKQFQDVTVTADKTTIAADGVDKATITAHIPAVLSEITFYHADTNEPIATLPVDPEAHTATLQVTATTPGVIRIRAGDPTATRLNEVVITAQ